MPVKLTRSPERHGEWCVSINETVIVCFSGPWAREQANRRCQELANLLGDVAVDVDAFAVDASTLITTRT